MTRREPTIVWDVAEEHLDEAAFLWDQWERALASPRRTISDVAEGPEERLRAHLDGLTLAGPEAAERLLVPALGEKEVGKVFSAAAALVGAGRLEMIRGAMPETETAGRAVGRALGLALPASEEPTLAAWLNEGDEGVQAMALEALAFRQAVPSTALSSFFGSRVPRIAAAALRAAGALGDAYRSQVEAALSSGQFEVRDAAIGAALLMGLRSGITACWRVVEQGGRDAAFALEVLALGGERQDLDRIAAALGNPALCPAAIWAAGLSGWPQAGDLCLPFLDDRRLGRLAFEALCCIGGAGIARYSASESEETAEAEGEEVLAPGPEGELPLPVGELVEHAWRKARSSLADGQRHLGGRPFSADELLRAFVGGPTRRRHALGLELALRSQGQYHIQTRSWARQQLEAQATAKRVAGTDFGAPLWRIFRD